MLRYLSLRNFRAFRQQSFEFSKINIFVGPNNSGKSSALSALNLIAQTFHQDELSTNPIALNGQFDKLGTYIDLVHGNRSNAPLGISFGVSQYDFVYDYKYRQQRREIELVNQEVYENKKAVFLYNTRKDSFSVKIGGQDIDQMSSFLRKRRPQFLQLIPIPPRLTLATLEADASALIPLRERLLNADRSLSRSRNALRRTFSAFDSISPFRDRPERTYLYSGEVTQRIGTTGSNMAMMLASDTSKRGSESLDILAEISRWFRVSGIAEEVRIKSLTPRHFEIVLADENGNEHNICDVGFGCSQVLPVLAASLNLFKGFDARQDNNSILVVQEPEIHLHPNAQASLGSFFTGLLRRGGQLFLETHSDNLVLRIARHVADGTLSPSDVRIYFVHKIKGMSHVEKVSVSEDGRFVPEWPGEFFPQRQSESLSLARASHLGRTTREQNEQLEFSYPEEK